MSGNKTVGLGILSWRGHVSLQQTLTTYTDASLFSLVDDTVIFSPDGDAHVRAVADRFPPRLEEGSENRGILNGMKEIAQRLDTDYVLFTENDCALIEPRKEVKKQLAQAASVLAGDEVIMVRLRHTTFPGQAFRTHDKYRHLFPSEHASASMKFRAAMTRMFRPGKVTRTAGTSVYLESSPETHFPDYISRTGDGILLVSTEVMPWSNQSVLVSREFFLDTLIPFCEAQPNLRGANGYRSVEVELNNTRFWRKSGWKIGILPGLFTHQRADNRGY